jgi:hypothetical protein
MTRTRRCVALLGVALACIAGCRTADHRGLEDRREVARGVEWFRSTDTSLVNGAGPIAISLLRLDPRHVRLTSALSGNTVLGAETVAEMAARHGAVAAVNGGFFNRENGEPVGLLKVGGELVSDTGATKGVVIIQAPQDEPMQLTFDQLAARVFLRFTKDNAPMTVRVDGVDTTRERGRLMLYTPRYHTDTDTAPAGTEWLLDGAPLRVVDVRVNAGRTPIPRTGAVLSYGGVHPPPALAALTPGVEVMFETRWRSRHGLDDTQLNASHDIVNGAGLLRRAGRVFTDWRAEGLGASAFTDTRHPRTLIGRDGEGFIWLVTVDGRQPDFSIGMTFEELQRLSDRLSLVDALNLDGGGSTTMVVKGQMVNRPSDPGGPRPVSDAIVVTQRPSSVQ